MSSIPGRFQPGNQLGVKVKVIDQMIRSCLIWDEDDASKRKERSRLRRAIEAQLDKAAEGNLESLDWLTTRVDGKAVQAVDVSANNGSAPLANMVIAAMLSLSERPLTIDASGQSLAIEHDAGEKKVSTHPPCNPAEGGDKLEYAPPDFDIQNSALLVPTNFDENSV